MRVPGLALILTAIALGSAGAGEAALRGQQFAQAKSSNVSCMPIGVTAAGELVFPWECREVIERERGPVSVDLSMPPKETALSQPPQSRAVPELSRPRAKRLPERLLRSTMVRRASPRRRAPTRNTSPRSPRPLASRRWQVRPPRRWIVVSRRNGWWPVAGKSTRKGLAPRSSLGRHSPSATCDLLRRPVSASVRLPRRQRKNSSNSFLNGLLTETGARAVSSERREARGPPPRRGLKASSRRRGTPASTVPATSGVLRRLSACGAEAVCQTSFSPEPELAEYLAC